MIKHRNHNILNISSKDRHELKPYVGEIIEVIANLTDDYKEDRQFRLLKACFLKDINANADHFWIKAKKTAAIHAGNVTLQAKIIKYKDKKFPNNVKYGIEIVDRWDSPSKNNSSKFKDKSRFKKRESKINFNETLDSEQKINKTSQLKIESIEPPGYEINLNESVVEYNKRHLNYGYVKSNSYLVENFEISYNTDCRQLILDTDINIDSRNNIPLVKDYIDIDTVIAKHICEKQNGDIFSKYIYKNKTLVKTYNLIFKNKVYRVLSNDAELKAEWLENKQRKKEAQRIAREKNEVERKEKIEFEEQERRKKIELEKREEIARKEHKRIEADKLKKESIRREKSKNSGILGKIWIRLTN